MGMMGPALGPLFPDKKAEELDLLNGEIFEKAHPPIERRRFGGSLF